MRVRVFVRVRALPQVVSKTVAQCVEYYYTYKKHVKIGRNGTLLYGEAGLNEGRANEAELDNKVSLQCACVCVCVCVCIGV